MTDSVSPTNDSVAPDTVTEDQLVEEPETSTPEIDETAAALDAAFAQTFKWPTSLEASLDGNWLVWLQPNDEGVLELWLSATAEGSQPFKVDLPFTPVEDRDPIAAADITRGCTATDFCVDRSSHRIPPALPSPEHIRMVIEQPSGSCHWHWNPSRQSSK